MPRGNDADAAGTELATRTGQDPNAEDLIAANQARWSTELRAANNRPINQQATDELDEDEVGGMVESKGEVNVLGFAVRGPFVVVVYEDEDGVLHKDAIQRKGHEKQAKRLAPKAKDPEEADKEHQREVESAQKESEDDEATEAQSEPEASEADPTQATAVTQAQAKPTGARGRRQ
jgi:hypothetical protein